MRSGELLRIETEDIGSSARVKLIGQLDLSTMAQLTEVFLRLTNESNTDIDATSRS